MAHRNGLGSTLRSASHGVAVMLLLIATQASAAKAQTVSRIDALLAADSLGAASRAADLLIGDPSIPAAQRASVANLFGRFAVADDADVSRDLGPGTAAALTRLAAGAVPEALENVEAGLARRPGHGSALRAITELGFGERGTGPALRATTDDPGMLLLVNIAARDTAGVREVVGVIDAARARVSLRNLPPPVALAEAELFLGDSAAALARLLAFDASWTRMERTVSWGAAQNGWLLGRAWLLLGDVALAMGRRPEAARAYGRVIALWEHGDADVQPAVGRARAGLAATRDGAGASIPSASAGFAALGPALDADVRVRYDAVLWMQPRVGADMGGRPLARLGFVTTEGTLRTPGGFAALQTYDSVMVDMPLLDALGDQGLAIRRQIQASAGAMTARTDADSLGRTTRRTLQTDAPLPEELRSLLERGIGFGPMSLTLPTQARAMKPGDEWTDVIAVAIPGAVTTLPMRATWRLTRIGMVGGRRMAFITLDATTRGAQARAAGDRVQATLTGELVRDLTTGATLRLAASLRATVYAANGDATPVRVLLTALREAAPEPASLAMR